MQTLAAEEDRACGMSNGPRTKLGLPCPLQSGSSNAPMQNLGVEHGELGIQNECSGFEALGKGSGGAEL
jgi:hypothetical protein